MRLLRTSLLWASQNRRVERIVRSSRAIRPLVSRFMPGETIDDAMQAVGRLASEGTPVIITYLGENVDSEKTADETVAEYERLIAALVATRADAHVSIKLTQFGWDLNRDTALARIRRLVRLAERNQMILAIDIESSPYVDSTVGAYETLARESQHVALCLQAYLHRTPDDLKRLMRVKPYIRLVKGAYRESPAIAAQDRSEIADRYAALAAELLAHVRTGARVVFGTHDMALVRRVREAARAIDVLDSAFEVQMLYGIQDAGRRELAADGVKTRVLISYGKAWYPWFMRRLAEKPSNLMLVTRNLFS